MPRLDRGRRFYRLPAWGADSKSSAASCRYWARMASWAIARAGHRSDAGGSDRGVCVGGQLARMIRYPGDPTAADLGVMVADEWQGRGVATALLDVLVRHRPAGVEQIVTVVSAGNPASIAMLRRLGGMKVNPRARGPISCRDRNRGMSASHRLAAARRAEVPEERALRH